MLKHLRDNHGDVYIWLIILSTVFIILFSAIFARMNATIAANQIRSDIDNSAESVLAEIKEEAYDRFLSGKTELAATVMTDDEVASILAQKLNAILAEDDTGATVIIKYDGAGELLYVLRHIDYTYLSGLEYESPAIHTSQNVYHTSTSSLCLTFTYETEIKFAGFNYGSMTKDCSYTTPLTFKSA